MPVIGVKASFGALSFAMNYTLTMAHALKLGAAATIGATLHATPAGDREDYKSPEVHCPSDRLINKAIDELWDKGKYGRETAIDMYRKQMECKAKEDK